ncbi:MAG: substrate-binding domain-containing protein [Spirochaetes bacterium]|nr:substrate-binding domain-containing protein [Spirochaetota bacterium]
MRDRRNGKSTALNAPRADKRPIAYITDMQFSSALHFVPNESVIAGMNKAARDNTVWLDFYDGTHDLKHWYRAKHYRSYAGFIGTIGGTFKARENVWRQLSRDVPCVRCMTPMDEPGPYVGVDEHAGMELAVKHLYDEGHRRIGFAAIGTAAYHEARKSGFIAAMQRYGMEAREAWMYDYTATAEELTATDYVKRMSTIAKLLAKQLAVKKMSVQAIVCPDDILARCFADEVRRLGMRVPHDIAITGFNDDGEFRDDAKAITSIHQDWTRIGYESVQLLVELIAQKRRPTDAAAVRLIPPKIAVRRSSLKSSLGIMHDGTFRDRVYEYIKANYTDSAAIRRMHEVFGLSKDHFSDRFKRAFGRSYTDIVTDYRLTIAAEKLRFAAHPITELYRACGFGTHQHFSALFKRVYDMTPSEYREKHLCVKE